MAGCGGSAQKRRQENLVPDTGLAVPWWMTRLSLGFAREMGPVCSCLKLSLVQAPSAPQ